MALLDIFRRKTSAPASLARLSEPAWAKEFSLPAGAVTPTSIAGFYNFGRLPRRGTPEILAAFEHMPYLRSVVGKIATNASQVPLRLYAKKKRGAKNIFGAQTFELDIGLRSASHRHKHARLKALRSGDGLAEIVDHPMLRLLETPIPSEPGFSGRTLMYLTVAWLDLVGDAFWAFDTNAAGMPIALYAIPPHWVREIPTRDSPTFKIRINADQFEVPVTNMLWFKDPSVLNPYGRGSGIGLAVADELDVDENAAKHVSSFFFNRAMPDMMVGIEGADDDALIAAKSKFESDHRGFTNAHRTAFTGGKITVERLDTTFKDMDLVALRKFSGRDIVIQSFGVSPEMLGILDNSNRATISEAREMFAENVLIPRLDLIESTLQQFARMFDERLIAVFDDPTPDDAQKKIVRAQARPSALTENEWRELIGHDPVEGGDVFRVPSGGVALERLDSDKVGAVVAVDGAESSDAAAVGAAPVQDTALTGAQVTSLLEIVTAVATGQLPKPSAAALIGAAFPAMSLEEIGRIIDPITVSTAPVVNPNL